MSPVRTIINEMLLLLMRGRNVDRAAGALRRGSKLAVLALSSAPAYGQTPSALLPPAEAGGQPGRLEEILVTAQRRSEPLQDVPVAVSSLSASALEQQGVTGVQNLAQAVPNLSFVTTVNLASPFIRGVGSRLFDPTSESPVAIYVDDVYYASPQANLFSFAGIKQIDVLAGPQGTLFGRNATGGVIQIQTLDPTSKTSIDASATYGSYQYTGASAYVAGGVFNNLATSLSFLYENQGKGYGTNIFNGSKVNKRAIDNISFRNKWVLDLPSSTLIRLSADYSRVRYNTAFQKSFSNDPVNYPGEYNSNADLDSLFQTRSGGLSLKIDQDFGVLSLTSVSAYRESHSRNFLDQDVSPVAALNFFYDQKFRNYSQELRFQNAPGSGIEWVLGGYYYNAKGGYDPLVINNSIAIRYDDQQTESLAVFGQATVELLSGLKLTGGARYTTEDQKFTLPAANVRLKQRFEEPTFRAAIDYKIAPHILAYVSYNTGFKSGGYNLLAPGNIFRPEKLRSWEAGFKSQLFDNSLRLNVAAFSYRYSDQQVSISAPGGSRISNAGTSDVKGLETTVDWVPTDRLNISGGFAWTDSEYIRYPSFQAYNDQGIPIGGPASQAGNRMINTPEFSGNLSARYSLSTKIGQIDIATGLQHNGGFYWDPANRVKEDAYTIVNASLAWMARDQRVGVKLFAKNLLGERYYMLRAIGAAPLGVHQSQAAPREFGVTLSYHY